MPPKTMSKTYDAKMDALARIHGHIGKLIVGHKEHRKATEVHGGKHPSDQPIPKGEAPARDEAKTDEVPEGAEKMSDQEAPFVNPLDEMSKPAKRGGAKRGYLAPHQRPPSAPKK